MTTGAQGSHGAFETERQQIYAWLSAAFHNVRVTEDRELLVRMDDTSVVCRFAVTEDGALVVQVEQPILCEVPKSPDFYHTVAVQNLFFPIGALVLGKGQEESTVWLFFRLALFVEELTASRLTRSVSLVTSQAKAIREEWQPGFGGFSLFEPR